jgi:predicted transcriptional regulator
MDRAEAYVRQPNTSPHRGTSPAPRTTGFTSVPNAIPALNLTPREEQLVNRLLKLRWTPHTVIWVRVKVLAGEMRCSVRTVQRAIDSLVRLGLLEVEPTYREDGGRGANRYHPSPLLTHYQTVEGECRDVASPVPERRPPVTGMAEQGKRHPEQTKKSSQTGVDYGFSYGSRAAWVSRYGPIAPG